MISESILQHFVHSRFMCVASIQDFSFCRFHLSSSHVFACVLFPIPFGVICMMDKKDLEDFEMVGSTSYVGETDAAGREIHVHVHLHLDAKGMGKGYSEFARVAAGSVDPVVNVSAGSSGSQEPVPPDMPPNERDAVFGRVDGSGSAVEQPLFMLKGSKVFHRKSCHHVRHCLPIERDGRLKAYLPCVCINSLGRDSYIIDGRVIHRQWCNRAHSDGVLHTFCRKCFDRGA